MKPTYTPKKIRTILFAVGITVAILLSVYAGFCMYERDMNFWEAHQGTSKSGNNGNVMDFATAEEFASNEAVSYVMIYLIFIVIGLLPGIGSAIAHKANPDKHITYTHQNLVRSIIISIVFVVLLVMFNPLFGVDVFFDNGVPSAPASAEQSDIWFEAKEIVESKLKAPSTAEFCSMSEASIQRNGDTWTIKGYVDAQNSFGVMLRNDFTVVLRFTSDTKYIIEQCKITAR